MLRAPGLLQILFLTLTWTAYALAGSPPPEDPHLGDPAARLLVRSPFAHGYLHGYEQGFHLGDSDFHVARVRTDNDLLHTGSHDGYRPEIGDHTSFRSGYRDGLLAGYADAIAGRDFRAYGELRELANTAADDGKAPDFDRGFHDGYGAGHKRGVRDDEGDGDFDAETSACPARPAKDGSLPASSQAYCDGYARAYTLGYADGYLTGGPPTEQVAASK